MSDRDNLQLPQQVYRLRVLGLALGFICIAAVLYERGAASVVWVVLAIHCFVWPHIAWYRARESADPQRAERQHLMIDSTMGGVFIALMQFSLLPSVLLVTMLSMDKLAWGVRFLLRSCAALLIACACTAWVTHATELVKGNVRMSITDTGGGVDPKVLAKLFHPFQTTKAAGLGLGLSICQSLIEAHGGRVGAGPHPAGGATFFFELPAGREVSA